MAKTLAEEAETETETEADLIANTGGCKEATGWVLDSAGATYLYSGGSSGTSVETAVQDISGWEIGTGFRTYSLTSSGAVSSPGLPQAAQAHDGIRAKLAIDDGYDVDDYTFDCFL
jgi:hypothetical protein